MSDEKQELSQKDIEVVNGFISGKTKPNMVQVYNILKNSFDHAIQKGVFNGNDTILLVRAFDVLRDHVNNLDNPLESKEVKSKKVEEKPEKKAEKKPEKTERPPRKREQ